MNKTKYITVRVDEALYNRFKAYTKDNMLNAAAVLRSLIQKMIQNT